MIPIRIAGPCGIVAGFFMLFEFSPKVRELEARLRAFMDEHIYPNESVYSKQIA
jgi:hypothetical protein